jgi:hypothetical protein
LESHQRKGQGKVEHAIRDRRDLLESTIEQRYGFAPDYVRKEVDDWFRWQNWRSPYFTTSILNHRSVKMPVLGPYRLKA